MAEEDRSAVVVGVTILTTVLSCVFVFARVFTRTIINPQFGSDDILIVVTLAIFLGLATSWLVAVHNGFGRHLADLTPDKAEAALRASIVGEVLALWTYPTGKAAVACLLMRLFPGKMLRWVLWAFVAVNAIFFYLNGIFILVHCSPISSQWDLSIKKFSCWNQVFFVVWGYVTGSIGAATDFAFAVVPWLYIAKLQMKFRKKLFLGLSLSLGLFPFVCSILKIYYLSGYGTFTDPTYSTVNLLLAGQTEMCAITIAACIPTLLPLYHWCRGKRVPASCESHSARVRGQSSPHSSSRYMKGRLRLTPTELRLRSIDDIPDHMTRLQSRESSVEEHESVMHQED